MVLILLQNYTPYAAYDNSGENFLSSSHTCRQPADCNVCPARCGDRRRMEYDKSS